MGIEREIDALASDAIASSEKELFASATGGEIADYDDEGAGDRSLEQMGTGLEGRHDEDEDEPAGEVEPEAQAEVDNQASRDDQGRFTPKADNQPGRVETPAERGLRGELTSERDKRKTVESEFATYRAEQDRRIAALEARLTAPPAPQPVKEEPKKEDAPPDRWTDPDGYDRWLEQRIVNRFQADRQSQEQRRLGWSFEDARTKHGAAFDEAYKAMNGLDGNDPVVRRQVDAVLQSANPGERLVAWHQQMTAAREIGDNPVAYRERVAAELRQSLMQDPDFRKQIVAELQGEARQVADGGRPRTLTQLPPSLNSARGGSLSRAGSGGATDSEIFDEVMS